MGAAGIFKRGMVSGGLFNLGLFPGGGQKSLTFTFDSAVSLDPVITGGTNVKWCLNGSVVATGAVPTPTLTTAGKYTIEMDDYADVTALSISADSVSDIGNIGLLTNMSVLSCFTNLLTLLDIGANLELAVIECPINNILSIDVSLLTKMTFLSVFNNPTLDVDQITTDIEAIKGILADGLNLNMGGTCPSVSTASNTLLLALKADNTLSVGSTWNYTP